MTRPMTTGAAMPTAVLRDQTENSSARQVNPMIGSAMIAQLEATSSSAATGAIVWPDRPVSGWWPTSGMLETTVDVASTARATRAKTTATTDLAQKSFDLLIERVSTVFHVPC